MTSQRPPAWPLVLLVTAGAYALVGIGSLRLAIPPGLATPLFPSAGIALVSVLLFGPRMLAGVWLGSLALNVYATSARMHGFAPDMLAIPAGLGVAAALQAAAGHWLVRRHVGLPLALAEPREIVRFFCFGAMLACLVGATASTLLLGATGIVALDDLPRTWWTWWAGDTLGVLIATPILLALIGQPSELWARRRGSVALPLTIVSLLAALAILQAKRWDEQRAQVVFERDAASAHGAIVQHLQQPLHALEAMYGLYSGSNEISRSEFRIAALPWSEPPTALRALGWAETVPAGRIAEFENETRAEGIPDFEVADLGGNGGERLPASGDPVVAARFIEPMHVTARALGINVLSVPAVKTALETAWRTGRPAASAAFQLPGDTPGRQGVTILRAVARGEQQTGLVPAGQMMGAVFVSMRMDDALTSVLAALPDDLSVCISDVSGNAAPRRLVGTPGCEAAPALSRQGLRQIRTMEFAQRQWQVRVDARGTPGGGSNIDTWLFSLVSLMASALFGALLLMMTGRTRRIEAAVEERTIELQREIDERARTESALRDSEQRFRNILDHIPIGVIYTDLNGYIKLSNPKFREMVGYSVGQLAGQSATELVHADDRDDNTAQVRQLVRGEISQFRRQLRFLRADGQSVGVRMLVTLLRNADGRPHRIVAVVEDITEHLKLQQAEDAREVAEAANRAKNDFLSRMSHELRTPLNAMLGFAQLVELDRQQPLSTSQREWVGQIQAAGWHLLEMINDTLDLSRIESGTLKLKIEPMDLPQVIAVTLSMVERSAAERRIAITQALSEQAAQICGDATRVKQILTNLLTNAVKYNVDGGRIHIASQPGEGDTVELTVTDSGLGMSEEQLAALFQPFNRLGRERSAQEGTGIGLVISRRLAELMGGRLTVRSIEGEGSSFILTLPRAVSREAARAAAAEEPPEDPADYHHRLVHYIEDNETNAIVMEGILAQRPQVRLRVSVNGLDGLAAIRLRPPSLILLDMHLPDIDGLPLLRMLKEDPATASIPVVVVSADAVASRIKAALDAGAQRYLTKPVEVAELLRLVDELLLERDTLFG